MVLRQEETGGSRRPRGSSSSSSGIASNSSSSNRSANDRINAPAPLYQHQHPPPPLPQPPQQAQHVLFNATKGENCQSLKRLFRRLRKAGVHVEINKEVDLPSLLLPPAQQQASHRRPLPPSLPPPALLVLACPREPFSFQERQALAQYLHQQKGGILLLLSEGWETTTTTTTTSSSSSSTSSASSSGKSKDSSSSGNVNAWLQPLGLHAHDDAVLRARRHPRYPHPKEVFLTLPTQDREGEGEEGGKGFSFVYPYGCSLSVQPPSKVLLSSGPLSYPPHRPLLAAWEGSSSSSSSEGGREGEEEEQEMKRRENDEGQPLPTRPAKSTTAAAAAAAAAAAPGGGRGGRVVVLGAAEVWADAWLDQEDNAALADALFQWLLHKDELDNIPSSSPSSLLLRTLFSNQISGAVGAAGVAAGHHDPSLPPSLQPRLRAPCLQDLAQQLRPCLQEDDEPTPQGHADLARLFFFPATGREGGRERGGGGEMGEEDPPLFALTPNVLLPEVLATYRVLGVEPEQPLRLIAPEFVCPQPPLRPAVFPPSFAALPPPMLEQFDLDVAFASPSTRLARLLHKCYQGKPPPARRRAGQGGREEEVKEAVDDLVYFVREAAEVVGVTLPPAASPPAAVQGTAGQDKGKGEERAKRLLAMLVDQLARWKGADRQAR